MAVSAEQLHDSKVVETLVEVLFQESFPADLELLDFQFFLLVLGQIVEEFPDLLGQFGILVG